MTNPANLPTAGTPGRARPRPEPSPVTSPAPPAAGPPAADAPRAGGLLYPLDLVYERAGIAAPEVAEVAPEEIPPPYRSLLVHRDDMTPTLERHFGGRVVLRPLSVFTSGGSYFRRVLLVSEYAGQPVEMGAIRMELDAFDAPVRRKI